MIVFKRPKVALGLLGDPFTLFYDYDQIEESKLSQLNGEQKAKWFERRLNMTFLEPLRRIWKDDQVAESLLTSKSNPNAECSFSVVAMVAMLSVVEALGSFRNPGLADESKHWEMFIEFLGSHMKEWNRNTGSNVSVPTVLWESFRNGITHGLRVGRVRQADDLWGSLEHHTNFADKKRRRFETWGRLLRICPEDFFDDLVSGAKDYFARLRDSRDLMGKFEKRFNIVYPN